MIPRFYLPQSLTVGEWITLPEAAARHVRVLRLRRGDAVSLFNGTGGAFSAIVRAIDNKQIQVEMSSFDPDAGCDAEPPYRITLVQGLASGSKMDWLIEKAVELGVDRIAPLITTNSVVQWIDERAARRRAHWQAIAIAACQQCGRNRIPAIETPLNFSEWLAALPQIDTGLDAHSSARFLLSPRAVCGFESFPLTPPTEPIALLIGPESGLSQAEEERAIAHGFIGVHLGSRILRTETAGLATLAALAVRWKGWRKSGTQ